MDSVFGKQSDCGDCVVTVFQRHCVDCSSIVTGDEHNGFQLNNQLENTKHPLSPKQRVSERNAMSGKKAGHRKTATSTLRIRCPCEKEFICPEPLSLTLFQFSKIQNI